METAGSSIKPQRAGAERLAADSPGHRGKKQKAPFYRGAGKNIVKGFKKVTSKNITNANYAPTVQNPEVPPFGQ
jgi:hypothetical protein